MPRCLHCLEETSAEHYNRVVHNQSALYGPWRGWRLAGRYLVSPDGDRILPERVRGMVFAEKYRRSRTAGTKSGQIVRLAPRLPERERFDGAA